MEEGAATVVPEASVGGDQLPVGSTVPTVVPEEAVGAEQRAEGVTVPLVVTEEAVGVDKRAEGSTGHMVAPDEAVDGDQRAGDSMVPMVVTEEQAVDAEQHADGSTVPMVVPEEAVGVGQNAEGSTVPMVVPDEAVDMEQHVDGSTVTRVVPDEAVDMEQHVELLAPAPVVNPGVAAGGDHHIEDSTSQDKHGDIDVIINVTPEEMRGIIQVIADTGKFWHEWSYLKRLLSLQLIQVLGEYSEAQMVNRADGQQQNSSSAETNSELFGQLNDALLRFEEGPPFTLQRLCEILLDPKGTYKKLPKLALALEKTLLVTSTITRCTDLYPATVHGPSPELQAIAKPVVAPAEPERPLRHQPAAVPNGTEHAGVGDGDEEMADAETAAAVPSGGSHDDVEMQEEKPDQMVDVVGSVAISGSAVVAGEAAVGASGQSPDPQSSL